MSKINKVTYEIETDSINKKIVLLTDIHYYKKSDMNKLNKLYNYLNELDYDYLCISGDFIDVGNIREEHLIIEWINKLADKSKIIIGLGGHDIVKDMKVKQYYYNSSFFDKIDEIDNVYLLDNKDYVVDNIRFIGLTLPLDYYYKYNENTNYFKRFVNNTFDEFKDMYNILLCHTPIPFTSNIDYHDIKLLRNVNLVLSGHMHAGIVPLFLRKKMKGTGIFSPGKRGMFPQEAYGIYKKGNMDLVISSGVTKASHTNPLPILDKFFDIEVTEIYLKGKN